MKAKWERVEEAFGLIIRRVAISPDDDERAIRAKAVSIAAKNYFDSLLFGISAVKIDARQKTWSERRRSLPTSWAEYSVPNPLDRCSST